MEMKRISLLLSILFLAAISYANEDMAIGTKQYKKQDFERSIESFSKAQKEKPKDAMINYNLACAYYKTGQYDKALEYYDNALNDTEDINFKSSILYNMGNSAYKKGDKDLSLNYYKSSLKLNSADMQTKHNIEFIQNDNKQDKNDNKKNKDNKQNKDKQNQQGQNKKQNQQQDKDKKNNQENQKKDDKKESQNKKNQNLLDYFDNQDKQNHDKAKDALSIQNSKTGKNW